MGLVFEVLGNGTQSLMSVRQAPNPRSYSLSTLPPNLKCVQNRLVGRTNTCPHDHSGDLSDTNDDRSKEDGGGDSEEEAVREVAKSEHTDRTLVSVRVVEGQGDSMDEDKIILGSGPSP